MDFSSLSPGSIRKRFEKWAWYRRETHRVSYAQMGEDAILFFLFRHELHIEHLTYIDVGANDPKHLSNTFLLSKEWKGHATGVLIEANPLLARRLKKKRPGELVINAGIVPVRPENNANMKFYIMDSETLSTFSEEEAKSLNHQGVVTTRIVEIPVFTINEMVRQSFGSRNTVDLLSIDIEGLDEDVIRSIDFSQWHPNVICVETKEYRKRKKSDAFQDMTSFLSNQGYVIFADTFMNTIYIKASVLFS